ncbi:hypothetical protein [Sporomusa malonica]|uniref:Uncharacterized protein n=1 Tax=Sporomusa malonica TaxID=112901 RepID=A0A1W2A9M7_9FIRM|nr:hypothetical protein [Sporomusa malonica]SMC57377.1 hypothetical protein SAMN04488500_105175 [Sporomusa malonica]
MENRNHKFRRKQFLTVDRLLIKLSTAAVVLLLVVQTLLLNGETRKYLSLVDKLEGEQITSPATMYAADVPWPNPDTTMNAVHKVVAKSIRTLRPSKNIIIRMINPPANMDAVVTVNGEVMGHFGKGKVELTIYDGDYIEIDAINIKAPAQFIIDTHHSDMVFPIDGIMLESKNNMIVVGKVVFKR